MIPEAFIQELLARVDIVDIVGKYVKLRKGGANLLGLCPFHNEKSPSFTVSPDKQFYHCFGCGAHGSALRFLTEHTGATFPDAVRTLAAGVGMQVPDTDFAASPRSRQLARAERTRRSMLEEVLQQANKRYRDSLAQTPQALEYLQKRGVSAEVAERFALGWAPRERRALEQVFPHYNDDPLLVESGMVVAADDGSRHDRFRARLMFPIHDRRGLIIGFGGRLLDKGEPKYLNSPETELFSKGQELYGLHLARAGIRAEKCVLVVEGYMDVVALAQHGLHNAVATLGTATTAEHLQKLRRASERIIFCFDGDSAGQKAAWRALLVCLPQLAEDVNIRFLFLPDGHDPDSYVRALGVESLRERIGSSLPLSRFMLQVLSERHDLAEVEGRVACIHAARPLLLDIPVGSMRQQLEREFAAMVRLTPEELLQTLNQGDAPAPASAGESSANSAAPARAARTPLKPVRLGKTSRPARGGSGAVTPLAKRLLCLLLAYPKLGLDLGEQQLELFAGHPHLKLVGKLLALIRSSGATHAGALLQAAPAEDELHAVLQGLSSALLSQDLPDPAAEWQDALLFIERQSLEQECQLLIDAGLGSSALKQRYQYLSRRLAQLKNDSARDAH